MISLCALAFGICAGGAWGLFRRWSMNVDEDSPANAKPHFPKLEAVWFGAIVFSLGAFTGARFFGNPDAQLIDLEDLWTTSFPFLIMATILLYFSLRMTRSTFFRPHGMKTKTWKILIFAPLGALIITIPAVEVLNRSTDLSPIQPFEVVVQEVVAASPVTLRPGSFCNVLVKSPLQDGELWRIRLQNSICEQVRVGITPLRLNLRDGRFGMPYIDSIELSSL